MAKLKAPLLSLGAAGAIGKVMVFFNWKGLDVVREYVVPSNPQTTNQTTQRGYLTAAVAAIHAAEQLATPLDEDDKTAYSLWGSNFPTPRTWFNQIVKNWCDVKVAGDVPIVYVDGYTTHTPATGLRLSVNIEEEADSTLAAGKFYLGTSKTNLNKIKTATIAAGASAYLLDADKYDDLVVGTKYYWQFRPDSGDGCEGAYSGIYTTVPT